jgi:hypothetical protein
LCFGADAETSANNHVYSIIPCNRLYRITVGNNAPALAGRVQSSTTGLNPFTHALKQLYVGLFPETLSTLFFHDKTFSDDTFNTGGQRTIGLQSESIKSTDMFYDLKYHSSNRGSVFSSVVRISQHVCAPVVNPNKRIGSLTPLNYESRHLPPEMRDFRLRFEDIDFSFLKTTKEPELSDMIFYEFNGGNQVPSQQPAMLYLPNFVEFKTETADDGTFSIDCFTAYGSPSFFCVFCRDNDGVGTQPLIRQLSISSQTTHKKSDTVFETDVHELYYLTQRNVHPMSGYDHAAFNKRQTILLAAEDIGILGLNVDSDYQKQKRATYRFAGTTDRGGRIHILLIYNNRTLAVKGRQLSVVRF